MDEIPLWSNRTEVARQGNNILRKAGAWTPSVHALLRHLEAEGFTGAPRVVGTGFDDKGREVLTYFEGDILHPKPWTDDGIVAVGQLLKKLHAATANFIPPNDAVWHPWDIRELSYSKIVFGHSDFMPWNLVSKNGIPFAAIDWDTAGPIDMLVELADVCWFNTQLRDQKFAEQAGSASPEMRARQLRLLVDGYELPTSERAQFTDIMIKVAVTGVVNCRPLESMAWRTEAIGRLIKEQRILNNALV